MAGAASALCNMRPERALQCAQTLAATAVVASAINIGGGFTITNRMLNMFKRPGDPTEHNYLYAIPAAVLLGVYGAGYAAGTAHT